MTALIIIVAALQAAAAVLAVVKLLQVPRTASKAVVLDVFTTISTGCLLVWSWAADSAFVLDIAMVYAVLSFAAVILVARYMERSI